MTWAQGREKVVNYIIRCLVVLNFVIINFCTEQMRDSLDNVPMFSDFDYEESESEQSTAVAK